MLFQSVPRFACAVLLLAGTAHAVQLEIHFPVLEHALSEAAFTQEGRRYVRGTKTTKCSFAYLEHPKLGGRQGWLTVKARFSGRSALDVFGQCVGLGDDFDLTIVAKPVCKDGKLTLSEVRIETTGRDTLYIRRVRAALGPAVQKAFSYPIEETARKVLEEQRPGVAYRQTLSDFQAGAVQVTDQSVVLTLDFRLSVK